MQTGLSSLIQPAVKDCTPWYSQLASKDSDSRVSFENFDYVGMLAYENSNINSQN